MEDCILEATMAAECPAHWSATKTTEHYQQTALAIQLCQQCPVLQNLWESITNEPS